MLSKIDIIEVIDLQKGASVSLFHSYKENL